jgi:ABC-type proline/glycine betaine transport system substrate-binding protein
MNNKYQIPKAKKPGTKAEMLQAQIEDLVRKRDAEKNPAAKQALQAEIVKLFAQYERAKL